LYLIIYIYLPLELGPLKIGLLPKTAAAADDDDEVRLCLWSAAANWPIHPPGDT
jgi:hypothetical protein